MMNIIDKRGLGDEDEDDELVKIKSRVVEEDAIDEDEIDLP